MENNKINPLAMPRADILAMFKKSGCPSMTDEILTKLTEAGMPVNEDGSINIIACTAWLLKEVSGYGHQPT